ncbi:MAG: hypothetical protein HOV81_39285 [Kofleriaceae bacterium]|nr:hypothetical protein [Kofleriaceae bacterium]
MRKLVIGSVLLASARIAASQPADPQQSPPEPEAKEPGQLPEVAPTAPLPAETAPGVPVVVAEPKKEKPSVSATYDNGLILESSDKQYELRIQFRNQMRFESNRPTEAGSQFLNKFYIPRSRLQAEGYVFGSANRYKLELGMDESGSFTFVKDMYIERRLSDAPVYVRFGQWKRPFSRAEIVSDFAAEFNERSIANDLAGGGRDLGISLNNDYEKSPAGIEWAVAMFNNFNGGADRPGIPVACVTNPTTLVTTCINGRPTDIPNDFGPTIVARAGWNSPNAKGYSEADLEGGPLRYSVGASYKVDLANFAKHGKASIADNMSHGLELDWNLKAHGISFTGLIVMMKIKDKETELGFNLQPGIMLVPKTIEVAARFALTTEGDRNFIEALGAFNYYAHGHRLKLASDFGVLKRTGEDPVTMLTDDPDVRVRIMAQLEI